jgi:hypothetical protein
MLYSLVAELGQIQWDRVGGVHMGGRIVLVGIGRATGCVGDLGEDNMRIVQVAFHLALVASSQQAYKPAAHLLGDCTGSPCPFAGWQVHTANQAWVLWSQQGRWSSH